jgi:ribosomal protein S18 acetylase RimI-like enzyme
MENKLNITIKPIVSSTDKDLFDCMNLMVKYFPKDCLINSNELIYWIDNYNKKYEDNLFCCPIKSDNVIIGYLEFVHFMGKFIHVDYLVIEKTFRTKEIMSEIYKQIDTMFIKTGCNSIILESGNEINQHDALIRLYNKFGFKKFEINYREPKFNCDLINKEQNWTAVPSTLMGINVNLSVSEVLNTLFFDHYRRWYLIYDSQLVKYSLFLSELIKDIINKKQ